MQRQRTYFFDGPKTTAGFKFNSQNIPQESTFRDLLDSIPFKAENGDYATETIQGLVTLSTAVVSKARTGAGVALPAHLPALTYGGNNTELLTPASPQSYQGIKITAIDKTYRLDYQVDFDPYSLTAKTSVVDADSVVIVDSADSNKPKQITIANIKTGIGGVWSRTGTVLSPKNAGDSLDMGAYLINAGGLTLYPAASASIVPLNRTDDVGTDVKISGGVPSSASVLHGGSVYIFGGDGSNGGTIGNVSLAYNGTTAKGKVGIGGGADSSFILKAYGNANITGTLTVGSNVISGNGGSAYMLSPDGTIGTKTLLNFMHEVVGGTPTGKNLLFYNGSAYTVLAVGTTTDKYLVTDGTTCAFGDLSLTNKVDNASIKAAAAIAFSKMAALTALQLAGFDGSGFIVSLPVATYPSLTELSYIKGLTSAIQTQFSKISGGGGTYTKSSSATIVLDVNATDSYKLNSTSNGIAVTLPAANLFTNGKKINILQVFSGGATRVTVSPAGADNLEVLSGLDAASFVYTTTGEVHTFVSNGVDTWIMFS